jgi:hypothetical protein
MKDKYNGWSNQETWLVNIWLLDGVTEPMTAKDLELMVKEAFKEVLESTTDKMAGFLRDMVNLRRIKWDELAEHIEELQRND